MKIDELCDYLDKFWGFGVFFLNVNKKKLDKNTSIYNA